MKPGPGFLPRLFFPATLALLALSSLAFASRRFGDIPNQVAHRLLEQLSLTLTSMAAAISIGIPLGAILSARNPNSPTPHESARRILAVPSAALLAILSVIPLLGRSFLSCWIALLLYTLIPIARSTARGFNSVSPMLRHSAQVLGLSRAAQYREILIPLALPSILAGLRTSLSLNTSIATISGFISGGGLGELIASGLAQHNPAAVLAGAIAAAILGLILDDAAAFTQYQFPVRTAAPNG